MEVKMLPFLTGTRVYGPAREDSDYDIVMFYNQADQLKILLESFGIEVTEPNIVLNPTYTGYEFVISGHCINVISVVDALDWAAWKYTTDRMTHCQPIENRENRIAIFNNLKERHYGPTR